jgi:addiction module HigA family antidote
MQPLGLSANRVGAAIAVPANRISEILKGRRSISADTALRLAELFRTEAEYWMQLQSEHDLAQARRDNGVEIRRVVAALRLVHPLPQHPEPPPTERTQAFDRAQFALFDGSE